MAAGVKVNDRILFLIEVFYFFFFIEIPLFHVLNARITFENVNGCRTAEKTSQMAGGAQCDSGKEWKCAVITSSYISVSGVHSRDGLTAENQTQVSNVLPLCLFDT